MNTYTRLAIVGIAPVIALINRHMSCKKARVVLRGGYSVGVTSLRLRTFATALTLKCVSCGLKAKFFSIDRQTNSVEIKPHLNLYGRDRAGNDVLFTHDHRLARSLGGADNLSNTQVMCSPCNFEKSIIEREELNAQKAAQTKASRRVVMGVNDWPEQDQEDFEIVDVQPDESDEDAIKRAKSHYSDDLECYILVYLQI